MRAIANHISYIQLFLSFVTLVSSDTLISESLTKRHVIFSSIIVNLLHLMNISKCLIALLKGENDQFGIKLLLMIILVRSSASTSTHLDQCSIRSILFSQIWEFREVNSCEFLLLFREHSRLYRPSASRLFGTPRLPNEGRGLAKFVSHDTDQ